MGWGPVDQDLVTFHMEYEMRDITLQQLPHSELDKRTNIRQEMKFGAQQTEPFRGHHFLIYLYGILSFELSTDSSFARPRLKMEKELPSNVMTKANTPMASRKGWQVPTTKPPTTIEPRWYLMHLGNLGHLWLWLWLLLLLLLLLHYLGASCMIQLHT